MEYYELLRVLHQSGYERVERDDRLLDIFPPEVREKGVELWQCWPRSAGPESHVAGLSVAADDNVNILRVRLPFHQQNLALYAIARPQLEHLLRKNTTASLVSFERLAEGPGVIHYCEGNAQLP